jgi:hypothetical protein
MKSIAESRQRFEEACAFHAARQEKRRAIDAVLARHGMTPEAVMTGATEFMMPGADYDFVLRSLAALQKSLDMTDDGFTNLSYFGFPVKRAA